MDAGWDARWDRPGAADRPPDGAADVALLGRHAVERLDVPRELARLLLAGRAVETDAWRREQPMQALAAQRQQLQVLSVLQALDLAHRLEPARGPGGGAGHGGAPGGGLPAAQREVHPGRLRANSFAAKKFPGGTPCAS